MKHDKEGGILDALEKGKMKLATPSKKKLNRLRQRQIIHSRKTNV